MFIVIEHNVVAHLLELVLVAVHDSDAQNEFLSVVVIENTVQVISKTLQKNMTSLEESRLASVKEDKIRMCVHNPPALIFSAICSIVSLRSVMCLRSSSIRSSQGEMRVTSKSGIS